MGELPRGSAGGEGASFVEDEPCANQGASQDGDQGQAIDGLRDEIEGARGKTLLGSFFIPIPGDDDHRGLETLASNEPQDLQPTASLHHEVAEDRVETFGGHQLEGSRCAVRRLGFNWAWVEKPAKYFGLPRLIIDNQHSPLGHYPPPLPTSCATAMPRTSKPDGKTDAPAGVE
jgi:hypothetical protein